MYKIRIFLIVILIGLITACETSTGPVCGDVTPIPLAPTDSIMADSGYTATAQICVSYGPNYLP
jgi:hypothetical protein